MTSKRRSYGPTFRWRGVVFESVTREGPHQSWRARLPLAGKTRRGLPRAVEVRVFETGPWIGGALYRALVLRPTGLLTGQAVVSTGTTRTAALDGLAFQIRMHHEVTERAAAFLYRVRMAWPKRRPKSSTAQRGKR